ncbi:archaellum operon transcriptional activator EarA family protein [Methanocella sp. MCL-LM]|uniref:archaellum operon transcriptional activator EarA family protein n=1 Tax=Methanocella sp. MCL-LM TaxID=3412035 RepID=UPI003C78491B
MHENTEPSSLMTIKIVFESEVKMRVLFFLAYDSSREWCAYDIAGVVNSSYENVIGVLCGKKGRYKRVKSLLYLGLVTRKKKKVGKRWLYFYKVTPEGAEIAETQRSYL